MTRTILLTGSTDGIGKLAALRLLKEGHEVLLHGRDPDKLARVREELSKRAGHPVEGFVADLSSMAEVARLADEVAAAHDRLDVLVHNAGVYRAPDVRTADGFDIRFAVNTFAPWLLTQRLLPLLPDDGRIVNLSSAAQSPVDLAALAGHEPLGEGAAYAQSKLALTMWTNHLPRGLGGRQVAVSVNPGSLLGTNMVREAFGITGGDVAIGADIVARAAVSDVFADASGRYYDNDIQAFGPPHRDALDAGRCQTVAEAIEQAVRGALA